MTDIDFETLPIEEIYDFIPEDEFVILNLGKLGLEAQPMFSLLNDKHLIKSVIRKSISENYFGGMYYYDLNFEFWYNWLFPKNENKYLKIETLLKSFQTFSKRNIYSTLNKYDIEKIQIQKNRTAITYELAEYIFKTEFPKVKYVCHRDYLYSSTIQEALAYAFYHLYYGTFPISGYNRMYILALIDLLNKYDLKYKFVDLGGRYCLKLFHVLIEFDGVEQERYYGIN